MAEICKHTLAASTTNKHVEMSKQERHTSLGFADLEHGCCHGHSSLVYTRRGPVAVLRDHAHLYKSQEARWTMRVVDSGRPRSSAMAFAASSRASHTCRHEMARPCDVKPGKIETNMDAISNLHQRRHPTEKASHDTINNGSTPTPTSLHRATSG
jgi:hypothetical protein